MERRRSSGTITKSMYYSQKRILAFLLTAAMVFTNLGTGLNVSYAGTADQVTFQMKGADLVAAVEEAIESGHEITADDLGFTNGRTAEFEKVFFGTKGAVYEVYPEMEGSSMEAELRVFVRLPEDAGDMYMVTGDEEIILLYVNNGEETISCTTEITRMDDDRVICMEKTNIRYVTPEDIGDRIEFASIDVSFISLTKVLGPVKQLLTDEGQVVCLIKPQFEAGREKVGKKGVVREKSVHLEVIEMVMDYARSIGFGILGLEFSPIKGPEGNIEYLLYLQNILQENGGQEDNVQKITGEKTTDQEEMNQSKTEHAEMKQTENHQAKRNQTEYELSARAIVEQAHGCLD